MLSRPVRKVVFVSAAAAALTLLSGCYYSVAKENMENAILENRLQEIEAKVGEIDSRLGLIEEINKGNKTFRRR